MASEHEIDGEPMDRSSDDDHSMATDSSEEEGSDESHGDADDDGDWFYQFDSEYGEEWDEEDPLALQELLDNLDGIGIADWDAIELAIARHPHQVRTYQGRRDHPSGYFFSSALVAVLQHNAPFGVVRAVVRAHPDAILGSVCTADEEWWDFEPLQLACAGDRHDDRTLKYLLQASLSALQHRCGDVDPLDMLSFLIEDEGGLCDFKDTPAISIRTLRVVLTELSTAIGDYNDACASDNEDQPSSTIDFLLKFATKKLIYLNVKNEGALSGFGNFFVSLLNVASNRETFCQKMRADEFYLHKILSRRWPPGWEQCEFVGILQSLILDAVDLAKKTRGLPSPLTCLYHGSRPVHLAIENQWPLDFIQKLYQGEPRALQVQDSTTGLYPFQLAAAFSLEERKERDAMKRRRNPSTAVKETDAAAFRIHEVVTKSSYEDNFGKELAETQALRSLTTCFHLLRCAPQVVRAFATINNE